MMVDAASVATITAIAVGVVTSVIGASWVSINRRISDQAMVFDAQLKEIKTEIKSLESILSVELRAIRDELRDLKPQRIIHGN